MADKDAAALDALMESDRPSGTRDALLRFTALVRQWSQKTDLVRVRTPDALAELLFLDALQLAAVVPEGASVIDVGAGAGAPGLPLAVLRPDLRLVLLEPRRRRVMFMRLAAGSLQVADRLEVREGRLDDPPAPETCGFDFAYSRATFAPPEWVRRGSALAREVGVLLAREEPPEPTSTLRLAQEHPYEVPSSGAPRRIVTFVTTEGGPDGPGLVGSAP